MKPLFSALGVICLMTFGLFTTVGLWVIGLASFLQWLGVLS